jgi:dephospho-CoA kinase
MSDEDITARIMAQTSEEELVQRADIVVRNDGTEEALTREADRVWAELKQRRDG